MKQQTPPQVGDRVEAFSPECRSWLKVTVIRRNANSFQGQDKDFQKWTGLKNWRPFVDEPETIPQKSEEMPVKAVLDALGCHPQALAILADRAKSSQLLTLKALRDLKDKGLAAEIPEGWVLAKNGYIVTRPDSWFSPPEKKDYQPEADGQLNLLEEAQPDEPPEPDDFNTLNEFTEAWKKWEEEGGNLQEGFEELQHVTPDQVWETYKDCKRHEVIMSWEADGTLKRYCPYCNEPGDLNEEILRAEIPPLIQCKADYEAAHSRKPSKALAEAVQLKNEQINHVEELIEGLKVNPPEPEPEPVEPVRGHLEKYYVEKRTKDGGTKRYEYHHLVYWDFDKKQEVKRHISNKELGRIRAGIAERIRREHEDSM